MTYDVYMNIYNVSLILACIMLIISVILFFVLKIPAVIGDLSGVTAKKAIEGIRNQNEESGEKTYKSSLVNKERGRLTDKISPTGSLHTPLSDRLGFGMKTEKISTQQLAMTESGETVVLNPIGETTVLVSTAGETEVLSVISQEFGFFQIEQEITFVHTQEIIPV